MLSYMKSECYRIATSKGLYLFTFGIAGFAFAINLLLFAMNHLEADFPYGTVRFSLSNLITLIYLVMFCAGLVTALLYADDRKNGTMKNALTIGLSRTQAFASKCFISCFFGLISMAVILFIYLGSAVLLLNGSSAEALTVLFQGILAILPTAIAAAIFAVASFHFIQSTTWAQIFWIAILFVVPMLIHTFGMYFESLALLSSWLPTNIFLYENLVTMSVFECVWQTPFGMMKCLVTGIIAIVLATAFGLWRTSKMEF